MSKNIIYSLVDPNTNEVRYIGLSSHGLKRARAHFTNKREINKKTHKATWIRSLLALKLQPKIVILEEVLDSKALPEREVFWIKQYKNLTNHTEGGEGTRGWKHSEETKIFITKLSKERRPTGSFKLSPEAKIKKSIASKEQFSSELARLEQSIRLGGKKFEVYKHGLYIGTWINKAQCAKDLKLHRNRIIVCLTHPEKNKSTRGYTFKYAENL